MSLDLSNTTQLAAALRRHRGDRQRQCAGEPSGRLHLDRTESLSFNYTNGASVAAYDIPLANVASPDNLTSVTGNAYQANSQFRARLSRNAGAGGLRLDRVLVARKLDCRSRHRTHRHDPGAERLRGQFQSLPDGREHSRRPQQVETVTESRSPMSLSAAFNIISSSFAANAAQTAVVSNNIANANTPGYSREIANVVTNSYGGADVASVTRMPTRRCPSRSRRSTSEAAAQQAISNGLATLAATVDDSASASSASGATQNGASPSAMLANLQSALTTYAGLADVFLGRRRGGHRPLPTRRLAQQRRARRSSRCGSRPTRTWPRRSLRSIRC